MTFLDRALQKWRIREAAMYLRAGDRVLDVGCADGTLFRQVRGLGASVGIGSGPRTRSYTRDTQRSFYPRAISTSSAT